MPIKSKKIVKLVSLLLLHAFFFEQLAYANPDLKPIEWKIVDDSHEKSLSWARKTLPLIPESVATLEDAYHAPSDGRTVILIQDAHTNDSGQINIAKTLDIILRQRTDKVVGHPREGGDQNLSADSRLRGNDDVRFVFTEAAIGDNSLSFLRKYARLEKRRQVATSYLKQGLLHGVEYLDLTSDHSFVLWGVENPELYRKSLDIYRQVAEKREKYQDYLARVESTIKTLKPRIFNISLLQLDENHDKYGKNELSLTQYFDILRAEAEIQGIPFSSYPDLQNLKKLKAKEEAVNFPKATEEEAAAVASLNPEDQNELKDLANALEKSPSKLGRQNKEEKAFFLLLYSLT